MRTTKRYVKDGFGIYRESSKNRWLVRVAPRNTPNNKEQRKRFSDRKHADSQAAYRAAVAWIEGRADAKQEGGKGSFLLSPHEQKAARTALDRLAGAGITLPLSEVIDYYLVREKPKGGSIDLATAITLFLTAKGGAGRAKHYFTRILGPVRQLAKHLVPVKKEKDTDERAGGKKQPKEEPGKGYACNHVTKEIIHDWLYVTKANLKQNGRRHYKNDLFTFFEWLKEQSYIAENPCAKLERIDKIPTKTGILSVPQCRLLLDAAQEYDLVAPVVLSLFGSARTEELGKIDWSDIHLDANPCLILEGSITKKKRRRVIDLQPNAVAWLLTCPNKTGPILPQPQRLRELHRRLKKLHPGVYSYPHNGLRHSFGSYALVKFGLEWTLAAMGHTGDSNTFYEHYRALVRKPAEELFWSLTPNNAEAQNVEPMPLAATA